MRLQHTDEPRLEAENDAHVSEPVPARRRLQCIVGRDIVEGPLERACTDHPCFIEPHHAATLAPHFLFQSRRSKEKVTKSSCCFVSGSRPSWRRIPSQ